MKDYEMFLKRVMGMRSRYGTVNLSGINEEENRYIEKLESEGLIKIIARRCNGVNFDFTCDGLHYFDDENTENEPKKNEGQNE